MGYQGYERLAAKLENHAQTQVEGERVVKTLFTPADEHDGKDAPGWCLKMARKLRARANKKRKNYEHKQIERNKPRYGPVRKPWQSDQT